MHAEIAGAGFAGLAAAIALRQRGWSVRVHEKEAALRAFGAGIFVWENGLRVLETLGVFDRVVADAIQVRIRERRDAGGKLFGIENTASSGRLYLPLRRALLMALRDGVIAEGGKITFGRGGVAADPTGASRFPTAAR